MFLWSATGTARFEEIGKSRQKLEFLFSLLKTATVKTSKFYTMARSLLALLASAAALLASVSSASAQYLIPGSSVPMSAAAPPLPRAPVNLPPGPGAPALASGSVVHLANGQAARILIEEEAFHESDDESEESEEDQFE